MSMKGQRKKNSGRKWSQLVNSALRGSFITMDSVYVCVHLCGVCVTVHTHRLWVEDTEGMEGTKVC